MASEREVEESLKRIQLELSEFDGRLEFAERRVQAIRYQNFVDNFLQGAVNPISDFLDFKLVDSPADPPSTFIRVFADTDNSNHLTQRDSAGAELDLVYLDADAIAAVEGEATLVLTGDVQVVSAGKFFEAADFRLDSATELTISTGDVAITQSYHRIDTQSDGATDNLDGMTGGNDGAILIIRPENNARTVVVRHNQNAANVKNILLAGGDNATLDDISDYMMFIYDVNLDTNGAWIEISRSGVIGDASYPNAVLRDGTRALTADWDVGAFKLTMAGLTIDTADGIDYNPGSDTDTDLITVGVSGTPILKWDESDDRFEFNKDITFGTAEGVLVGALPGGHVQADDGVRFNLTGSIPSGVFSQTPSGTAGTNAGFAINHNLVGTYQSGRVGGYLRIDTDSKRMVLQGYNGTTFIDMFSVPLHTSFIPTGSDADAWIRTDDGEVRVRGAQGGNACIIDIQGFATTALAAFRLIPKGTPSPDRSLCQFFGTDFTADSSNYTALALIATGTKMIVRSQGEGTESGLPLTFEIRDGGVNTEGLRLDASALVIVSKGLDIATDNVKLRFGTGLDAAIYFDGTDLILQPDVLVANIGDVLINFDGDDSKNALGFGARSGGDIRMYWNGTDFYIEPSSGATEGDVIIRMDGDADSGALAFGKALGGDVRLYWDGSDFQIELPANSDVVLNQDLQMSGRVIFGNTGASGTLTLSSTTNASKGQIYFGSGLNSAYIENLDRLTINTLVAGGTIHADQRSTTAAIPVLVLDQADVDEDFFKFIGTSDTNVDRALVDAADFTTPGAIVGWLKINVQDDQATNPITDGDYYMPFYAAPTA